MAYDPSEQDIIIREFTKLLKEVTKDGGRKRAAGEKPPWWRDGAHEPAIFSHLNKWKHGEKVDKDSGVHPLVHLAWRALAIAYQETAGRHDPEGCDCDNYSSTAHPVNCLKTDPQKSCNFLGCLCLNPLGSCWRCNLGQHYIAP